MGAADVDAVRGGYEAFNRRDVDTVLALLDPDIVFRMAMDPMGVHPLFRGRDGVRELFATLWQSFDEFRAELAEVTDMGDVVVAGGRMVARRSGEADPTKFKFSHFWRVREGCAVAVAFHDTTNPFALLEDQLRSRLGPRSTRD